jgi:hypothetical protein
MPAVPEAGLTESHDPLCVIGVAVNGIEAPPEAVTLTVWDAGACDPAGELNVSDAGAATRVCVWLTVRFTAMLCGVLPAAVMVTVPV